MLPCQEGLALNCGRMTRKLHLWLLHLGLTEHIINAITKWCWAEGSREGATQERSPSSLMLILIESHARAFLERLTHFKVTPTIRVIMAQMRINILL